MILLSSVSVPLVPRGERKKKNNRAEREQMLVYGLVFWRLDDKNASVCAWAQAGIGWDGRARWVSIYYALAEEGCRGLDRVGMWVGVFGCALSLSFSSLLAGC